MSVSREDLEKMALEAVSAEAYYELLDCMGETPDEDLWKIINNKS